jgi:hypothetical protein
MRELLFGDVPLDRWPERDDLASEPWRSFIEARRAFGAGDRAGAIARWRRVLELPDLESRQVLQAWNALRLGGVGPPAEVARQLEGVVVEVGLEGGVDLVAAYTDRSARYVNFSGAAVVWEHPDESVDAEIDALLEAGRPVVAATGPWDRPRPGPPANGQVRLNLLTPGGLHFGQGSYRDLAADALGGPVVAAALRLMQALIARVQPGRTSQ